MSNAASLLLPGSNLTNLLVLEQEHVSGAESPRVRPRLDLRVLGLLFALAIVFGPLARLWGGPADLLESSGRWATAGIGAFAAILVNNLPAAVLLSAHPPPHPRALLVGLDLGPNLVVTESLSAYLWWQAAKRAGALPSALTYSRLGIVLAPLAGVAALAALALFAPRSF